jgi:hypothetical protein
VIIAVAFDNKTDLYTQIDLYLYFTGFVLKHSTLNEQLAMDKESPFLYTHREIRMDYDCYYSTL